MYVWLNEGAGLVTGAQFDSLLGPAAVNMLKVIFSVFCYKGLIVSYPSVKILIKLRTPYATGLLLLLVSSSVDKSLSFWL